MDLLVEAKHNNKTAFNELFDKYVNIFYKTARIFFMNESDITIVLKETMSYTFQNLIEVKDEKEYLIWSLKYLIKISNKLVEENKKDINKQIEEKNLKLLVSGSNGISSTFSAEYMEEYKNYRKTSIVEEYLTSISKELRLPSILYFYANLSIEDISKITGINTDNLSILIDKARTAIYEIIMNKEVDL